MRTKPHRLQFDVSTEAKREYEELQARSELPTMASFITCALTIFCWSLRKVEEGMQVGAFDEKGDKFISFVTPAFFELQRKAKYQTITETEKDPDRKESKFLVGVP